VAVSEWEIRTSTCWIGGCGPHSRPRGYGTTRMELRFLGRQDRCLVPILTELIMLKAHSSSGATQNFEIKCTEKLMFMSGCECHSKRFLFRRFEEAVTSARVVVSIRGGHLCEQRQLCMNK
jgi:hypothetical protein